MSVKFSVDGGPTVIEACFNSVWRGPSSQLWNELTYYPHKSFLWETSKASQNGIDFDELVDFWGRALNLWGINLFGHELTRETFSSHKGFSFPNTVKKSQDAATFLACTAIRYLDECADTLYQMVRLGELHPDEFAGTGEHLWNAFCVAHHYNITGEEVPFATFGHTLIGTPRLSEYPGDGNIQKPSPGIYSSLPTPDLSAPEWMAGYNHVAGPEYLKAVLIYLRNK